MHKKSPPTARGRHPNMSIILQSLGVIMQLFPEVDEKRTIRNAKNFLKKQLPKMMIQARVSSLSLKSPVISDMPSGSSCGNSNESKYIYMLQRLSDEDFLTTRDIADEMGEKELVKNRKLSQKIKYVMDNHNGYKFSNKRINGYTKRGYKKI